MASASFLKTSPVVDRSEFVKGQTLRLPSIAGVKFHPNGSSSLTVRAASSYADELVKTAVCSCILKSHYLNKVLFFWTEFVLTEL